MFQSTHLHEVRHDDGWVDGQKLCFNPRTYMRCDLMMHQIKIIYIKFQSTHLHEVRRALMVAYLSLCRFQSTHLHEVRLINIQTFRTINSFNPRTYMRCDPSTCFSSSSRWSFNPRTYMRCDEDKKAGSPITTVSIHAPT